MFTPALTLRRIRQMTSVIAVADMRNIGMAKYHSPLTNSRKACIVDSPTQPETGPPILLYTASSRS